jgi:hypothetical protein
MTGRDLNVHNRYTPGTRLPSAAPFLSNPAGQHAPEASGREQNRQLQQNVHGEKRRDSPPWARRRICRSPPKNRRNNGEESRALPRIASSSPEIEERERGKNTERFRRKTKEKLHGSQNSNATHLHVEPTMRPGIQICGVKP